MSTPDLQYYFSVSPWRDMFIICRSSYGLRYRHPNSEKDLSKIFLFRQNDNFQPYFKYLAMLVLVAFVIVSAIFTILVVHTLIIITTRGDRKFSLSRASLNSSFTHRNAILSLFMQVIWKQTFLWPANEIYLVLGSGIYIWTSRLHNHIRLCINWLYIY